MTDSMREAKAAASAAKERDRTPVRRKIEAGRESMRLTLSAMPRRETLSLLRMRALLELGAMVDE